MRYSRKMQYTILLILGLLIFSSLSTTSLAFSGPTAEERGQTMIISMKSNVRIPTNPNNFKIVFHLHHDPLIEQSQLRDLFETLNDTFQISTLTTQLRATDLESQDVLVIFGPSEKYSDTTTEIPIIHEFLEKGGSLLIAADSDNDVKVASDEIMEPYGITFGNDTATGNTILPEPYVFVKDFSSPRIPALDNVTQLVYHGTNLTLNEEFAYKNNTLFKERYPLMFADSDTWEGYDSTILAAAVELNRGRSRILVTGSIDMWNNTFIQNSTEIDRGDLINIPGTSLNVSFIDNTLFAENAFKWLGGTIGHFKFSNDSIQAPTVEVEKQFAEQSGTYQTLEIGKIVSGSVVVRDWSNVPLDSANITFSLERTGNILRKGQMTENQTGYYNGYVNTTGIDSGWIDATFTASRRGFVENWFEAETGRIWLEPEPKTLTPINLAMLTLLGA
ncbi:MAG: hypothetical protein FK732_13060, partial [Asgard group archaeon]|nr:hypothetical protein [Asgard group archaeon]